jgi:FHA domain/GAF domain
MSKLYVLSGLDMGRSFDIKEGSNYLGRSPFNDIEITDPTVSKTHLFIDQRKGRYFITDLGSRNGTLLNGTYLNPGVETEVEERMPIAIGMTVIGLGEGCSKLLTPFLDSIGLTRESGQNGGIFMSYQGRTKQKKLQILHRITQVIALDLPIEETLQKILDQIFDLLKKIDRCSFVLIEPETREVTRTISKVSSSGSQPSPLYCDDVVNRVIREGRPIVISDVQSEKDELSDTLKLLRIQAVLCLPLRGKFETLGALYMDSLGGSYSFRPNDVRLLEGLAEKTALSIQYKRFSSELSKIAESLASLD